jgi:hypothetical protein
MRRWHFISLAFLALALFRIWIYGRARRMWLVGCGLFLLTVSAQANITITLNNPTLYNGANQSWKQQFSYGACPGSLSSVQSISGSTVSGSLSSGTWVLSIDPSYTGTNCPSCDWDSYKFSYTDGSGATNYDTGWSPPLCDGGAATLTINGPAPCVTNLMFTVKNNDSIVHVYYQATSPTVTAEAGVLELQPGQSGSSQSSWLCDMASSVHLYSEVNSPGGSVHVYEGNMDGTGEGSGTGGTDTGAPSSGSPVSGTPTPLPPTSVGSAPLNQYNPTNVLQSGTNSPILWSPASGTNAAVAAQQGFNSLYDSGVKASDQAHLDAQAIEAGLNGIFTNGQAVAIADANMLSNVFSKGLSLTGLVVIASNTISLGTNIAEETTLRGMSNLFGSFFSTNVSSLMLASAFGISTQAVGGLLGQLGGGVPGSATNGTAASAAGTAAEGDYGVDTALTGMGTGSGSGSGTGSGSGSAGSPDMTMIFCGRTIDLDPVHRFPAVVLVSFYGTKAVTEIMFLLLAGKLYWDLVRSKSGAQPGGVPNLFVQASAEFLGIGGGLGSNVLGVIVALIVPTVFIGLYTVVLAWIFSNIGLTIADSFDLSNFTGNLGTIGLYLVSSLFPLNTIWTCACLSVTMHFTLAKMYNIASNAARYLFGR